MVSIKEIESFKDYGRCICVTNGVIEAYVTVDIGPRIIRFGYVDGQNRCAQTARHSVLRTDKDLPLISARASTGRISAGTGYGCRPKAIPKHIIRI